MVEASNGLLLVGEWVSSKYNMQGVPTAKGLVFVLIKECGSVVGRI